MDEGKVLILEDHGFHDLPGGRLDRGENAIDALERELIEELPGISSIDIGPLIGWHRPLDYTHQDHGLFLVVFLTCASVPNPVRLSHEHDHAAWHPVVDARSVLRAMTIDWDRIG